MNAAPRLSVILLTKENASYVFRRTLDSLRLQTVGMAEIIVVDCNQPGDLYSMSMQEDIRKMSDVQLVPIAPFDTIAMVCNRAIGLCTGEYLGILDASDEWHEDKAQLQIDAMEASGSAACCCNGFRSLAKHDGSISNHLIFRTADETPSHWLTTEQFALASQILYRTEELRAIGCFDPALNALLHQDALIRLKAGKAVTFLPDVLVDNTVLVPFHTHDVLYEDMKHLFYKHYDMLLHDRGMYQEVNYHLAYHAAGCKQWPQMAIHFVVGFFKSPFRIIKLAAGAIGRFVGVNGKEAFRQCQLNLSTRHINRVIKSMRGGKRLTPALPISGLALISEPFTVDLDKHDHPHAFANRHDLRYVVLPSRMTVIRKGMFAGCRNLERIEIPLSVLKIEDGAFQECVNLRSVVFQQGSQLNSIGDYAFAGCSALVEVTFSGVLTHVGIYAFALCTNLQRLNFIYAEDTHLVVKQQYPTTLPGISRGMFAGCCSLPTVEFPDEAQLNYVADDAFLGCTALRSVCITGFIKYIGSYAFAFCDKLSGFTMPHVDGVTVMGPGAFQGCQSLTFFRIPYELLIVRRNTFRGCIALKYVKIPKKVILIEPHAFADCTELTQVIILSRKTKYLANAFDQHAKIECNA